MLAIRGIYDNGKISLQGKVKATKPVNVIVTFLEDIEAPISKKFDLQKFSFNKSKELSKDYEGSLGDAVIEERKSEL